MRITIGAVLVLLYLFNTKIVEYYYPDLGTDYDSFVKAYYLRLKIYELMFGMFFYIVMVSTRKFVRAIFTFGFMLCLASCFDKWVLEIHHYLWTDIIVFLSALIVSCIVYKREKHEIG